MKAYIQHQHPNVGVTLSYVLKRQTRVQMTRHDELLYHLKKIKNKGNCHSVPSTSHFKWNGTEDGYSGNSQLFRAVEYDRQPPNPFEFFRETFLLSFR